MGPRPIEADLSGPEVPIRAAQKNLPSLTVPELSHKRILISQINSAERTHVNDLWHASTS